MKGTSLLYEQQARSGNDTPKGATKELTEINFTKGAFIFYLKYGS